MSERTEVTEPADAPPVAPRRIAAFDVLRGLCIVSMTTAHLAAGSLPYEVLHAAVWIDGAVGFVFLSGLVLGVVQRSRADRPTGVVTRTLLRRAGLIYLAHLFLVVLALVIAAVDPERTSTLAPRPLASVDGVGGLGPTIWAALTLRISPPLVSILSLYVVCLLLAVPAVLALRRGWWPLVVGGSLVLYAVGYVVGEGSTALPRSTFTFPQFPGVPGAVNWACWQLLFLVGLTIGWHWRSERVQSLVGNVRVIAAAAVALALFVVLGYAVTEGPTAIWRTSVQSLFLEGRLGLGTIVMALLAFLVLRPAAAWLLDTVPMVASPFARLGRHALDCYLILSTVVLLTPSVFRLEGASLLATLYAFDVLVLCWVWCLVRDRRRARPPAPVP
ncbi:OpgC domain-containing protein [Nakamurella leprariae]|uniref:OpgC domain-containing protein n=1 Tax=Nakamurella leprariae TaxID=2803911 RepID=A0A938YAT6_9ACTN|nr:OpgC domain-containing protein [Nakamurella leprariae]MBM9469111.1 OpgC domain-containing protein [Nakamurella leprariae]